MPPTCTDPTPGADSQTQISAESKGRERLPERAKVSPPTRTHCMSAQPACPIPDARTEPHHLPPDLSSLMFRIVKPYRMLRRGVSPFSDTDSSGLATRKTTAHQLEADAILVLPPPPVSAVTGGVASALATLPSLPPRTELPSQHLLLGEPLRIPALAHSLQTARGGFAPWPLQPLEHSPPPSIEPSSLPEAPPA